MFYKRLPIHLSERSLLRIIFGQPNPQTREIFHDVKLLNSALERMKRNNVTESNNVNKQIISEFKQRPIFGLNVGELLELNEYRVIVDGNDNIALFKVNPLDSVHLRSVEEVVFLYDSEDFFFGSKTMQSIVKQIQDINDDLDQFLDSISQESQFLLRVILKDEFKLESLHKKHD